MSRAAGCSGTGLPPFPELLPACPVQFWQVAAASIVFFGLHAPHVLPFLQCEHLVQLLQAGHGSLPVHF